ncbi:MAG: MaoC family dehydratase N-terminal domain-containing protein [Firmicutes bacterium]|nr:MaoC family dehydratase N-terminal domain-containing protein [Bacillota bacterium]
MFQVDATTWGQPSSPQVREVERGAIRKFARALGLSNPVHFSVDAAVAAGFRDLVAPPTFPITLVTWEVPGLVLPSAGLIHGEQTIRLGASICAGDVITVRAWGDDVKSRAGVRGRMHIVSVINQGSGQNGEEVFWTRAVVIVHEEGMTRENG